MLEGQGLFALAARSAAYASAAHNKGAAHYSNVFERREKPSGFAGTSLGALTVDANTTIRAMFQKAWDKLHEDDNFISDDMIKRLEKVSKSDSKDVAAERLRQAKAKLRALRLQAQVAAASGDTKTLKRIAQEAARAAREVAGAARGLAGSIVSNATADGSASGSLPVAASGGQAATEPSATPSPTSANSDPLATGREQLRELGDDARSAIAQAKGLIAFASQMARMHRRQRPDAGEDSDYRALQQSVSESAQDLDGTLSDALASLQSGVDAGGLSVVETTTLAVQMSVEVTVTANLVI
jgi:hypothetical protein